MQVKTHTKGPDVLSFEHHILLHVLKEALEVKSSSNYNGVKPNLINANI
jgi:hypothetical protein